MLIDSHCHIHYPGLVEHIPDLVANMAASKVEAAVVIATELDETPTLARLVDAHPCLFATVGVHPCSAQEARCSVAELVAWVGSHPKFVALGECGLDFHHKGLASSAWQLARLAAHVEAASETGLPLVVHTRDSIDATLDALASPLRAGLQAVLHCFTGTRAQAERALELGAMLSFTGIVTFKSAAKLLKLASAVPLERIMVETDAPYLAPEPHRGERNEPAYVSHTAARIARARQLEPAAFAAATTANARRFFKLPS